MALFTHPNIVRFIGVDPKHRCIVTEYIPHGSLHRYLRRLPRPAGASNTLLAVPTSKGSSGNIRSASSPVVSPPASPMATSSSEISLFRYNWPLVLRIAADTAHALAYLHSLHPPVIHADVKSPNVLLACVDPTASTPVAKLADFGLMRRYEFLGCVVCVCTYVRVCMRTCVWCSMVKPLW